MAKQLSLATLDDRRFYKMGEVARIVGVKPHVLRYWETEFPALSPMKTRGSHRHYRKRDIEVAMRIRALVHDQGFTVAGAKKQLARERRAGGSPEVGATVKVDTGKAAAREVALRAELLEIRAELETLLHSLDQRDAPIYEPPPMSA